MDGGSKTLIAIDDSPAADLAFQFYATMLRQPNGSILLLHVVEPRTISSNQTVLHLVEIREKAANEEKKRVKELQEKYEDRMRACGIKGRIVITYYSRNPGKVICQTASAEGCSMIIIGYSSKTHSNQVGSVCKYVFRNAPCPIAIVPSRGIPVKQQTSSPRHCLDLPPDYDTARRLSLAVPVLRRTSEADIKRSTLVSSCPDITELGDDHGEDEKSKPVRRNGTDVAPDLRKVTAQVHETKL